MDFIDQKAEAYALKYTSKPAEVLQENELESIATNRQVHMISGQVQGKLLEFISAMIRPQKVLEIGTFTGFSAICLAKGLQPGGELHTIEVREDDATFAARYFKKAGVEDRIKLHVGNAIEIIPQLTEQWDLVFIDADKVNYIEYYELTLPLLKPGGWILADNVLFHGQVLEDEIKGKNAKAIHAFNEHVASDSRVEQVMLTVRDGLLLIRKLQE